MGMGIIGAHRLMDQVEIDTKSGVGTDVLLKKILPPRAPPITPDAVGAHRRATEHQRAR